MAKKTITLARDVSNVPGLAAAAAITPGHLIEVTSSGTIQKHSTAGGYAERMFATEDTSKNGSIDTAYAAGEEVQNRIYKRGEIVYAWIKAGVGIAREEKLISAGDGTLIGVADAASAAVVKDVIAVATAALDLTASGAVATRLEIRIL